MWRERADEAIAATDDTESFEDRKANAVAELADTMKAEFEDGAESLVGVTGFWVDLMNGALSEVNWDEIARHILEGIEA